MNVPLITLDREQAKDKLDAYRSQLRHRADSEYEAAEAGYKALTQGKSLLNLTDAILSGGLGEDGRPKLAVARADKKEVRVRLWGVGNGRVTFSTSFGSRGRMARGTQHSFSFLGASNSTSDGYALVPMVPADVRPNVNLSQCVILWEVVQWASRSSQRPPYDPYLLRRIAGDLYAVLTEWNLTELERAVMQARVVA